MARRNSVAIVERFWREVWQQKNPNAADHLVAEDFGVTSGANVISSRAAFKEWVAGFLASVDDFNFEIVEMFQNESGDRVVSRWVVTGRNNGFLASVPSQAAIRMTGIAVIQLRDDGLLQHNWVERSAPEVQA